MSLVSKILFFAGILFFVCLLLGCVERELVIQSIPENATVLLDGEEIGKTPLKYKFDFYGTREIIIRKSGYETLRFNIKIKPPFYEIIPLDFAVENLLPAKVKVGEKIIIKLKEKTGEDRREIIEKAQIFRKM